MYLIYAKYFFPHAIGEKFSFLNVFNPAIRYTYREFTCSVCIIKFRRFLCNSCALSFLQIKILHDQNYHDSFSKLRINSSGTNCRREWINSMPVYCQRRGSRWILPRNYSRHPIVVIAAANQHRIRTIQFGGRFRVARSTVITDRNQTHRTARFVRTQRGTIFDVWHAIKWSSKWRRGTGVDLTRYIEVIDNEYAA